MVKTVLVVGASYAGLAISHRLLKQTRPQNPDLKIVLISKNNHFYWNLASIRAIIPGTIPDTALFHPIEPGFTSYPPSSFQFLLGTATSIDPTAKTATFETATGPQTIPYDYCVLATGARAVNANVPWKAAGSHLDILQQLHDTQTKVQAARHIVVAGAGTTGVETSAEIRYHCKDKTVLLLSAGKELLSGDIIAGAAEKEITALGVQVKKNARVESTKKLADGKTEVTLQGGEKIVTDFYLPTMGLVPNTEFLPKSSLREGKYVDVDDNFQVKGLKDVWAAGDIVSKPRAGFMLADKQAAGVAKNVELALQGKPQLSVKGFPFDVLIGAAGKDRGFARAGWVRLPSFMAWAAKSRTLGLDSAPKYVNGTQW